MNREEFEPTSEQKRVVDHDGSAFVRACPGAGKSRVIVERARVLLTRHLHRRGCALLSFTTVAVSELQARLARDGVLVAPTFPHFVGTFDSFLWTFLVAPFGVPGTGVPARLIEDKDDIAVRPYSGAREIPLRCFDRRTGAIDSRTARNIAFDPNPSQTGAYSRAATRLRARLLAGGVLDFADVRDVASERLEAETFSRRVGIALAARFKEIVVDEAQDCNPADLEVIRWLRDAGIAVKVVCDPDQTIYGFRGSRKEELDSFCKTFEEDDRLSMTGNFRSSRPICEAVTALRAVCDRDPPIQALGGFSAVTSPVQVLEYGGKVSTAIGTRFRELVHREGLPLGSCPLLAATRDSGDKAVGQAPKPAGHHLTLRLAAAASLFHGASTAADLREAIEEAHAVVLHVQGRLATLTYRQYLNSEGLGPGQWRPNIVRLLRALQYAPQRFNSPRDWHTKAKALLQPHIRPGATPIGRRLPWHQGVVAALSSSSQTGVAAKTIHAAKGMQFPGVCVLMTTATAKRIIDYLEDGTGPQNAEETRKIYVAASRAQKLLVIAVPEAQAARLARHLWASCSAVQTLRA